MLYEAKLYLWSSILSSWLCWVIGLHMTIVIVVWNEIICMLILYDILNMKCQHDFIIICLCLWSYIKLMEFLTCICYMVCALKTFIVLSMFVWRDHNWSFFIHVLICYVHIPIHSTCGVLTPLLYITTTICSGHEFKEVDLKKFGTLSLCLGRSLCSWMLSFIFQLMKT